MVAPDGQVKDEGYGIESLLQEPDDYRAKQGAPYTSEKYQLPSGLIISTRLIGHSPLWMSSQKALLTGQAKGHHLWNAAKVVSDYLEKEGHSLVKDRNILELGAGGALPSIVSAIHGAAAVVITDYPDTDLIDNIRQNVSSCPLIREKCRVHVEGYIWGHSIEPLVRHLPFISQQSGFDTIIMADLVFNHSEHHKLISTMQQSLKHSADAMALAFFSPYRPWLLSKDLDFFELASRSGFKVVKVSEVVMDDVMFENDPGDALLRRTVFGYEISWRKDTLEGLGDFHPA